MSQKQYTFNGRPIETVSPQSFVALAHAAIQLLVARSDYEGLAAIAYYAEALIFDSANQPTIHEKACSDNHEDNG